MRNSLKTFSFVFNASFCEEKRTVLNSKALDVFFKKVRYTTMHSISGSSER